LKRLLEISSAVLGLTDKILPGSKLENYFADAQECNEDCFFSFKAWPPVSGVSSPQVVIDILEIVLVQFDHFFSNSIRKNLAIVSLLSKIAHLPHPGLQAFLLRGVNNTTQGAQLGYSICLFSRICMISKSIQDIYEATPDLKEKVGLIRSHCKDDIMSMIHLVGRAPLSVGMKELTQLLAGRSELAVKQDDKSNPVMFSNFLPQVLILSEFCKEMAVILFLVHKTLEIDGRSSY
jgi:hypothetical protein